MRTRSRVSTLLRFGLRSMPGSLWGFYAIYVGLLVIQIIVVATMGIESSRRALEDVSAVPLAPVPPRVTMTNAST